MDYWLQILHELHHYQDLGFHCLFTNLKESGHFEEKYENDCADLVPLKKITRHNYPLHGISGNLHLTPREAECVFFLLRNYTIKEVGNILELSPRTVEFYLKNIKRKLSCRKKRDVLDTIRRSSFASDPSVFADMQHLFPDNKLAN